MVQVYLQMDSKYLVILLATSVFNGRDLIILYIEYFYIPNKFLLVTADFDKIHNVCRGKPKKGRGGPREAKRLRHSSEPDYDYEDDLDMM